MKKNKLNKNLKKNVSFYKNPKLMNQMFFELINKINLLNNKIKRV